MVWQKRGRDDATGLSDDESQEGLFLLRLRDRGRRFEDNWRSGYEAVSQLATLDPEVDSDEAINSEATREPPGPVAPTGDLARLITRPIKDQSSPETSSIGNVHASAVIAADPREGVLRYRRSAVALAVSTDTADAATEEARECASALIGDDHLGHYHLGEQRFRPGLHGHLTAPVCTLCEAAS